MKDIPGAEIVLMACHAGATFNGGVGLLKALAKKFNATVHYCPDKSGLKQL